MKKIALWTACLLALLAIFHTAILTALGNFLVKAEPPVKSDVIVVLAGDGFGNRILKAGELVRDGFAPRALVSGPDGTYGNYECDLAIAFAVRSGFPESYFVRLPHHGRSTEEEAQAVIEKLRELGAKRVTLVTSTYHTRRAAKIFRRAAPGIDFHMVSAPDKYFTPDGWWRDREARKIFLLEWTKTVWEW